MSIAKWYRSTPLPSLRTHSWKLRIVATFSVFAGLLCMAAFSVLDASSSRYKHHRHLHGTSLPSFHSPLYEVPSASVWVPWPWRLSSLFFLPMYSMRLLLVEVGHGQYGYHGTSSSAMVCTTTSNSVTAATFMAPASCP